MKRRVEEWTVDKLYRTRERIAFPDYQRQSNLWPLDKQRRLIDSILRDIDIPKLYFSEGKDGFEVVDGQQRLWAIWNFLDGEYTLSTDGDARYFEKLSREQQKRIRDYKLQITIFEDATDDYLRELFVRLQLGLWLVTGERLHAETGAMKDFVFGKIAKHKFVSRLGIAERRFAKETLCAQITINSFTKAKLNTFARTRYEDLLHLFKEYKQPQGDDLVFFQRQTKEIVVVLNDLWDSFGTSSEKLTNRSYILSVYLLFEDLRGTLETTKSRKLFVEFVFALWDRLRQEVSAGIDRTNRDLYKFETMVSSAPGERYQIQHRDEELRDYYSYYLSKRKIKGD